MGWKGRRQRRTHCSGPSWSEEIQSRTSRARKQQVEARSDSRGCWMPLGHEAVERTSPPDAFSRVAVFGDHAPAAQAAGTQQPKRNCQLRNHRSQTTTKRTLRTLPSRPAGAGCTSLMRWRGNSVASMRCPRYQNGTGTHTRACRARMLSRMASQTTVAPPSPAVQNGPEPGGEKRGRQDRGREDRGRGAVMDAADDLQRQASNSSQQEQGECSKVRRTMGLETWTAEEEPGGGVGAQEAVRSPVSTVARGRRGAGGANTGGSHTSKASARHEVRSEA